MFRQYIKLMTQFLYLKNSLYKNILAYYFNNHKVPTVVAHIRYFNEKCLTKTR